jgi:hypothetical protein
MNDKFLRSYRIAPRLAFAQDMRKRLEIDREKTLRVRTLLLRPVALGAITLLLVLTLTLVVSPAARAQVQDWVGQVGGVLFTATGDYPGGDEPVTIAPSEKMSLEDASAILPFTIDLPAWVPEGYVLEETVTFVHFEDGVERIFIQWRAPQKALLELEIEKLPPEESKWLVGLESIEEVLVDGEPAALVRGGWHADTKQWENPEILHLYIPHKGQTYIFSSMEKDIPVDELIRMAESLP